MSTLQEKMATFGFEANDDYAYPVHCLLNSQVKGIRCLNIEGDSDRRKTAFASALANALEYTHIHYHDFTQQHEPLPKVLLPESKDEEGREEPPIEALDRIFSEVCAYSESESTVLILDQLHAADFREHIRLYHFVLGCEWHYSDVSFTANPRNLLLFLISEHPLYHSLQKSSFSIWVNAASDRQVGYQPADFGLEKEAIDMMAALAHLFDALKVVPTRSEYSRLLHDIHYHVRTAEGLGYSIYGWTEGIDHQHLRSEEITQALKQAMTVIEQYLGVDEVELDTMPLPTEGDV